MNAPALVAFILAGRGLCENAGLGEAPILEMVLHRTPGSAVQDSEAA